MKKRFRKTNIETDFTTKKKGSLIDVDEDTSVNSVKMLRIVLDVSGSVQNFLDDMVKLIKESLYILKNPLGLKILVSISVFSSYHQVIVPFTDINELDIESIPFPKAYGYTRTGQALLESVADVMSLYEKLKAQQKTSGHEIYPGTVFLISDGKTYGGQNENEIQQNLRKYREAEIKIKSYEKLPPMGLDKLYFFACALDGMLGSASKQELQQLTHYPERVFIASSREIFKKKLAEVMYTTITNVTHYY